MEYQKKINMLENTQNQPTKFRTKNWVEINDDSRGTYSHKKKTIFKIKTPIIVKNRNNQKYQ